MFKAEISNRAGYLQSTETFDSEEEVREEAMIIIDSYINDWIVDGVCREEDRDRIREQFDIEIVEE